MPRSSITCRRCGYTTTHLGCYHNHVKRKRLCKATRSQDMPTVDNYIRGAPEAAAAAAAAAEGAGAGAGAGATIVNAPQAQSVVVNNTNTTTHVHNTTNIIQINPVGKEDLSHVTDKEWRRFVKMCVDDNGHGAVADLVSLVNYNPAHPENMNMYFPPPGTSAPGVLCFYQRTGQPSRWRWVDKDLAIRWLADDKVSNIFTYVEDNAEAVSKKAAQRVEKCVE